MVFQPRFASFQPRFYDFFVATQHFSAAFLRLFNLKPLKILFFQKNKLFIQYHSRPAPPE